MNAQSPHSDERIEPLALEPNSWPELPASEWVDDVRESDSREHEHLHRLAREQKGIR